ncbi:fimbrial protein [Bacteroides thetaiotaomicron]|uniref:fimbrial protein n=1 Tax=Bacteroides thetaiotaomicron TaxID=818 RepID=UPI0034A4A0A2
MKVKSLFLSMCAIAALASCSQNDEEVPGGSEGNAPEAKVIIKLAGSGEQATSRAAGIPGDLNTKNSTVNDLTVFIFNQTGTVIKKEYIGNPATTGANTIQTTTDAKRVAVVANTGDLTGTGGLFASVASEDALKAVVSDMLKDPSNPTGDLTHKDDNLYMSGVDDLSAFADDGNGGQLASVTIQLHFPSVRLSLTKISFNGGTVTDNKYVQKDQFAGDADANFTIDRVYLMNVQRTTHFLPATTNGSDYITQDLKKYTGGVAWSAPWTGSKPNDYQPNNEYTIETGFATETGLAANEISNIGHWYTFANTGVSDLTNHPTALVVEVRWRKTKADATVSPAVAEEVQTLYFTTYFGGGDQVELEAGKAYSLALKLNGNFKPSNSGGSGGGGTTDPTQPTVNSSVEVTVTPASWDIVPEIPKEWK